MFDTSTKAKTAVPERHNSGIIGVFFTVRNELDYFLRARLGAQDEAEDILQELYLRLHKLEASLLEQIRSPKQYLFKMASNMANDSGYKRNRRQQVHQDIALLYEITHGEAHCPVTIIEKQQKVDRLLQAIASLPPKRRQVFLLYRYRNLTRLQLVHELGLSIEAVDKHLVRALQHCREWLEGAGV